MRLALVFAAAVLASCAHDDRQWQPTPGAAIKVDADVAPAFPLPSDCPPELTAAMYRVMAVTPGTVTIRDELLIVNRWTVPQHCVAPYVLR